MLKVNKIIVRKHHHSTHPMSLKTNRRVNTSQILAVKRWELYMACATKQPTSLTASYLKLPQIWITRFYTLRVQPENFEWHEIMIRPKNWCFYDHDHPEVGLKNPKIREFQSDIYLPFTRNIHHSCMQGKYMWVRWIRHGIFMIPGIVLKRWQLH